MHPIRQAIWDARHAMTWGQRQTAECFGISQRTMQRWDAGRGTPTPNMLCNLARAVFPNDAELATRIAQLAGTSLVGLGLIAAPLPPAPVLAPAPAQPPPPPARLLVDSITCAAADAMGMVPDTVRPALRAAFERARDLHISAAEVAAALAPPKPPDPKAQGGPQARPK